MFTSIQYDPGIHPSIARINRETGDLYINPKLWDRYTPEQKEVILLHEEGHFVLQTPSELEANHYAIENFLQEGQITETEFNRKLTILTSVLHNNTPQTPNQPTSNLGPLVLPLIGLGTVVFGGAFNLFNQKEAKKREQQQIEGQLKLAALQADQQKSILIIAAVSIIFIMMLLIVIFKVRKNARK